VMLGGSGGRITAAGAPQRRAARGTVGLRRRAARGLRDTGSEQLSLAVAATRAAAGLSQRDRVLLPGRAAWVHMNPGRERRLCRCRGNAGQEQ
jgi:hypothetical protein